MNILATVIAGLHAVAERRQTPAEHRASEAIDEMNAAAERVISKGTGDPLRDQLDSMAEHR